MIFHQLWGVHIKKIIVTLVILCLLLTGLQVIPTVSRGEKEVISSYQTQSSKRGNTLYVGHGQTYSSIQSAINAAQDGDTIRVFAGTYYEKLTINKKLSIIGNGTQCTTINPYYVSGISKIISIESDDVTIKGFVLKCNGFVRGIVFSNKLGIKISDITCNNISYEGIWIQFGHNIEIMNYTGNSNQAGMYISTSTNVRVLNSNLCKNEDYGIFISGNNSTIQNSNISHNKRRGIYIICSHNILVKYNTLVDNYQENIRIFEGCENNTIILNNFYNKSGNCSVIDHDKNNKWNTSEKGNYWSDWASPDNDSNGIVDVPRNIPGLGGLKDHFPLVNPMVMPNNNQNDGKGKAIIIRNGKNYSHIQDAINNAISGDIIRVWDGIYYENVLVDRSLTIIGNGSKNTVIDANDNGFVMIVNSVNCNISGLKIINSGYGMGVQNHKAGIQINKGYNKISNCYLDNNQYGIQIQNGDHVTIENSTINDSYLYGIWAFSSNNTKINDCTSNNNGYYGLRIRECENFKIKNCTGNLNSYGMVLRYSYNGVIEDSEFSYNKENNLFIEYSSHNKIINNTFKINGSAGIYSGAGSDNNQFYYNNFIGQVKQQFSERQGHDIGSNNKWDNNQMGNYWSDWTSPDNNSDGIVDKPYILSGGKNAKDNFPLVQPIIEIPKPPNKPPKILTKNIQLAYIGKLYSVNYTANDPDTSQNNLKWAMKTNASWLIFSSTQQLSGTPNNSDIGTYWVNISVSEGENIDYSNFTVRVIDIKSNTLTITTQNVLTAYVRKLYSVNYTVAENYTSLNGLNWSMRSNSSWLAFSPEQELFGTPSYSDIGTVWVNISVSLGNNQDWTNFTINVYNIHSKKTTSAHPIITTQNVITAYVGELYSVNYSATDTDTSIINLTWTIKTNASWLNFSASQELYGTPSNMNIGTYWINISVSDGENRNSTNFSLTVKKKKFVPNIILPEIISTNIIDKSTNISINNTKVSIVFSNSMDRFSVESAISIKPFVDYRVAWNNDNTELLISFNEELCYNTTYIIIINNSAKDIQGNTMKEPFRLVFTTQSEPEKKKEQDNSKNNNNENDNNNNSKKENTDIQNISYLILIIVLIFTISVLVSTYLLVFNVRRKKVDEIDHRVNINYRKPLSKYPEELETRIKNKIENKKY